MGQQGITMSAGPITPPVSTLPTGQAPNDIITYVLRGVDASGNIVEFEVHARPDEPPSLGFPWGRRSWCPIMEFRRRGLKPSSVWRKGPT